MTSLNEQAHLTVRRIYSSNIWLGEKQINYYIMTIFEVSLGFCLAPNSSEWEIFTHVSIFPHVS